MYNLQTTGSRLLVASCEVQALAITETHMVHSKPSRSEVTVHALPPAQGLGGPATVLDSSAGVSFYVQGGVLSLAVGGECIVVGTFNTISVHGFSGECLRSCADVGVGARIAVSPCCRYISCLSREMDVMQTIGFDDLQFIRSFRDTDDATLHKVSNIHAPVFSRCSSSVAVCFRDKVRVFSVASGEVLHRIDYHSNWLGGMAFSQCGRFFVTSSADKTVLMYDLHKCAVAHRFDDVRNVYGLALCDNLTHVALIGRAGMLVKRIPPEERRIGIEVESFSEFAVARAPLRHVDQGDTGCKCC